MLPFEYSCILRCNLFPLYDHYITIQLTDSESFNVVLFNGYLACVKGSRGLLCVLVAMCVCSVLYLIYMLLEGTERRNNELIAQ